MESNISQPEQQPAPWLYKHPQVRAAAETDEHLAQLLHMVDVLDERLEAGDEHPTTLARRDTMRIMIQDELAGRFADLLPLETEQ